MSEFDSRQDNLEFLMAKYALRYVIFECFGFPCQYHSTLFHTHTSVTSHQLYIKLQSLNKTLHRPPPPRTPACVTLQPWRHTTKWGMLAWLARHTVYSKCQRALDRPKCRRLLHPVDAPQACYENVSRFWLTTSLLLNTERVSIFVRQLFAGWIHYFNKLCWYN
jgi:hypothetical protein